ncbi:uncharacterized protein CLUP02_18018 [Colletotrichum lupini]|uniref:Uncharacterized protein n=1 Tax=Colletotrichum lupini TaxID=145971 RepID=A0A9Q8WBG6_9PEZI|nr:uncharacterized protein CLUP02_18018 [Colletotrichum lupini]UQC76505.1 hypothetical protein CLUP02_18018 [Colletotrichum lupini]
MPVESSPANPKLTNHIEPIPTYVTSPGRTLQYTSTASYRQRDPKDNKNSTGCIAVPRPLRGLRSLAVASSFGELWLLTITMPGSMGRGNLAKNAIDHGMELTPTAQPRHPHAPRDFHPAIRAVTGENQLLDVDIAGKSRPSCPPVQGQPGAADGSHGHGSSPKVRHAERFALARDLRYVGLPLTRSVQSLRLTHHRATFLEPFCPSLPVARRCRALTGNVRVFWTCGVYSSECLRYSPLHFPQTFHTTLTLTLARLEYGNAETRRLVSDNKRTHLTETNLLSLCLPTTCPERTFAVFRHSPMNTRAHYLGNGSQAKDSDPRRRISQDADSPGKLCFPLPPHSRFCQSETRRSSHGKKTPSRNCKLCSLIRRPSGIQFEQHSILDGLKYPGVPGSENDDPKNSPGKRKLEHIVKITTKSTRIPSSAKSLAIGVVSPRDPVACDSAAFGFSSFSFHSDKVALHCIERPLGQEGLGDQGQGQKKTRAVLRLHPYSVRGAAEPPTSSFDFRCAPNLPTQYLTFRCRIIQNRQWAGYYNVIERSDRRPNDSDRIVRLSHRDLLVTPGATLLLHREINRAPAKFEEAEEML